MNVVILLDMMKALCPCLQQETEIIEQKNNGSDFLSSHMQLSTDEKNSSLTHSIHLRAQKQSSGGKLGYTQMTNMKEREERKIGS